MEYKQELKNIKNSILNSYSQIFFSDNNYYSLILVLVSFIDFYAGVSGVIAVLSANFTAKVLGFNQNKIIKGVYGFNPLLVGIGLGIYFKFSIILLLIIIIFSIFTLFINLALEGILGKYYLPYLSIPFILSIWTANLVSQEISTIGISERGVYLLNDLYLLGGEKLVGFYTYFNELQIYIPVKTYLISLGAIFFQYNLLAGILIAVGLLFVSRISFILSILGFASAYFFYKIIGSDISTIQYSYIGFNYILTSIAIGGFFIIPSKKSYLWAVILIPIVAILTISLSKVFAMFSLSIYSLPFNIVVILFVYILKLRINPHKGLAEVVLQQNSPEKNLYSYLNYYKRYSQQLNFVTVKLPFWGSWTVSQAYNGEYTHKNEWQHALDFVITDNENKQFKANGNNCDEYYCFNKDVLAPFNGYIVEVDESVEDNKIGEKNLAKNWGNTVIIKYSDFFYSKLSHLKKDSITVKVGDFVISGQSIAKVGNSGNSSYPHLHFQLQATPYIGSKTISYPIGYYLLKNSKKQELKYFEIPKKNDIISNIDKNNLLENAYKFIAGKNINVKLISENNTIQWNIYSDIYNNQYLYCEKTNSLAYFTKDDNFFYFNKFTGNKKSLLYYFFLANYKVSFSFIKDIEIIDAINPQNIYSKFTMFFQDVIAPFYLYLSTNYKLKYTAFENDMIASKIQIESEITKKNKVFLTFKIEIDDKGIYKFIIIKNNKTETYEIS